MLRLNQIIEFTDMVRSSPYGEYQIWINLRTQETEVINQMLATSEEIDEFGPERSSEWILFRPEIYDSTLIESFIGTIHDGELRNLMYVLFQGRGKYRRIKTYFARSSLLERFYRYENAYVRNVAIEWCRTHGIPYEE